MIDDFCNVVGRRDMDDLSRGDEEVVKILDVEWYNLKRNVFLYVI